MENDDKSPDWTILFACGSNERCDHDFKGYREFEDGLGGESACTKCGMGALHHSLWTGE